MPPLTLGVNIDHIAVLREARKINDPDPLMALEICAQNGADQITIHLREDRRHIQDEDARAIIRASRLPVNLECSVDAGIIDIICALRPHRATLVPEKREEVTTEGGLDVKGQRFALDITIERLSAEAIPVSLFIDPDLETISLSKQLGAQMIELHTGRYANLYAMAHTALPYSHHAIEALDLPRSELKRLLERELETLRKAADYGRSLGLEVAAGHGLNYQNVGAVAAIESISELNIGQSIIARSVFTGLAEAVRGMKALCVR
ncbi:MAG: pyridoxine 5'-phosphate synthase [Campylobacterales bacterium]|nr:pyridoxine 5'-phosphate synthase [Campylobacterales bacterium]